MVYHPCCFEVYLRQNNNSAHKAIYAREKNIAPDLKSPEELLEQSHSRTMTHMI